MKTAPTSTRGFTLVELSIALTVTAILATTAVPSMQSVIDTRRLDGVATQFATDVQLVRTEAVTRNLPVRLSFHDTASGQCYVVHTGDAAQCECRGDGAAQCTGDAQQIKTVHLPTSGRVSLQANASSMLVDPLQGTVSPTGTVRVAGPQGREVHQIVNIMGRVRSCSPQAAVRGYRAC